MTKQIALLRGINVGGHGKLQMAELRAILSDLGATDIATYIQSGNAVFTGNLTAAKISDAIQAAKGFHRPCFVLKANDLKTLASENPFKAAENEPKSLHLFFLSEPSQTDPAELTAAKSDQEHFAFANRVLYLHSPGGLSASKLASNLDRRLGVITTGRNWATITSLLAMSA